MTPADFRAARLSLGLTQAQLAAVMGYSGQSRIAEIETGARNPSHAAQRLMDAYVAGYRPDDWP
jgi:transcriptional regulator with XRE-family HTH domain